MSSKCVGRRGWSFAPPVLRDRRSGRDKSLPRFSVNLQPLNLSTVQWCKIKQSEGVIAVCSGRRDNCRCSDREGTANVGDGSDAALPVQQAVSGVSEFA